MVSFLLFLFDSFLMDAGAPAEVMSMALAKIVEANGRVLITHKHRGSIVASFDK